MNNAFTVCVWNVAPTASPIIFTNRMHIRRIGIAKYTRPNRRKTVEPYRIARDFRAITRQFAEVVAALRREELKQLSPKRSARRLRCQHLTSVKLSLPLFVTGILAANDHNFAVTADNFAFVAHRFDRRSYFHDVSPVNGFML